MKRALPWLFGALVLLSSTLLWSACLDVSPTPPFDCKPGTCATAGGSPSGSLSSQGAGGSS